jgi:aminopeptidase N
LTTLTYEEAQARSRLIEVLGYHVELDVTGGGDVFESVTAVRFGCCAPGTDTFIEIRPTRLRRVVLNGRTWIRRHWPGTGCR